LLAGSFSCLYQNEFIPMLRILHLLTGLAALLLSFTPSLRSEALPYLLQTDALLLLLFGLLNLLLGSFVIYRESEKHPALQVVVSALLILSVVCQAVVVLAPLDFLAGQPAVAAGLLLATLGVLLNVVIHWPQSHTRPAQGFASSELGNRETGTVKWFNTSKGFGFISRDSGDDIFVHFRAIRGEGHRVLIEGQRVEFSVMQRDKGLQAEDVIAASPSRR